MKPVKETDGKWAQSGLESFVLMPDVIDSHWPVIEPMLARALKYGRGELVISDIYGMLKTQQAHAFVTQRGDEIEFVAVVELVDFPRFRVAHVTALGGKNIKDASQFLPALEKWALFMGAVEIRGYCTESQLRLYRRMGFPFAPVYTIISHDLRGQLQ